VVHHLTRDGEVLVVVEVVGVTGDLDQTFDQEVTDSGLRPPTRTALLRRTEMGLPFGWSSNAAEDTRHPPVSQFAVIHHFGIRRQRASSSATVRSSLYGMSRFCWRMLR
jgi:hypothetical protein